VLTQKSHSDDFQFDKPHVDVVKRVMVIREIEVDFLVFEDVMKVLEDFEIAVTMNAVHRSIYEFHHTCLYHLGTIIPLTDLPTKDCSL
jgi:hypothetical protein